MKPRTSTYPVGPILLEALEECGNNAVHFAARIGYGNVSKCVGNLDCWLENGVGAKLFLERFRTGFPDLTPRLEAALEETRPIVEREAAERHARWEAEKRAAFVPFVQATTERARPSSITFFCITGGPLRQTVYLDRSVPELSEDEQFAIVRDAIKAHYEKREGRTLFQGRITGYVYKFSYDEKGLLFDTTGEPLNEPAEPTGVEPVLFIGRRRFEGCIL